MFVHFRWLDGFTEWRKVEQTPSRIWASLTSGKRACFHRSTFDRDGVTMMEYIEQKAAYQPNTATGELEDVTGKYSFVDWDGPKGDA